jgi:small subunit ribosomal protein S2
MTKNFQGLTGITKTPDAMFVIDPKKEQIAVTEAQKMNIPIVSVLSTDCDLKQVEYPIVANDASVLSITFFLSKIKEALGNGVKNNKIIPSLTSLPVKQVLSSIDSLINISFPPI